MTGIGIPNATTKINIIKVITEAHAVPSLSLESSHM